MNHQIYRIGIVFGCMVLCFSCNKVEETCDVKGYHYVDFFDEIGAVKSNEYIAAYPGSWWHFSDGIERVCTEVETDLMERSTNETLCIVTINSTHVLLPKIVDIIYYDSKIVVEDSVTKFQKLIDTVLASSWTEYQGSGATRPKFTRSVVAHYENYELPNGDVYSDVYEILKNKSFYTGSSYVNFKDHFYFAKGIGVIREVIPYCPLQGYPIDQDRYLVDHYIAPH